MDGGPRVLAAAHSDHDDGEEEEEASHGEADAVHRLVADDDGAVHLVLQPGDGGAADTEARNLMAGKTGRWPTGRGQRGSAGDPSAGGT